MNKENPMDKMDELDSEMDYGSDFVTLTDEEGNAFELEHLDTLEHKGITYMAFTPADAEEGEEVEVIILKVEINGDEEELVTVEDDDELDEVYELFMQRISEEEDEEE